MRAVCKSVCKSLYQSRSALESSFKSVFSLVLMRKKRHNWSCWLNSATPFWLDQRHPERERRGEGGGPRCIKKNDKKINQADINRSSWSDKRQINWYNFKENGNDSIQVAKIETGGIELEAEIWCSVWVSRVDNEICTLLQGQRESEFTQDSYERMTAWMNESTQYWVNHEEKEGREEHCIEFSNGLIEGWFTRSSWPGFSNPFKAATPKTETDANAVEVGATPDQWKWFQDEKSTNDKLLTGWL